MIVRDDKIILDRKFEVESFKQLLMSFSEYQDFIVLSSPIEKNFRDNYRKNRGHPQNDPALAFFGIRPGNLRARRNFVEQQLLNDTIDLCYSLKGSD